jgi:hypothetical protein
VTSELPLDPVAIDVGDLLQRTVASLYSHLVTRETGRAVRMAIEAQLHDAGDMSLSLIDLSEVTVLDFSCADEVVAKLLQRYQGPDRAEAFFVFRGVREPHRHQIEVVLERQGLAAVAETGPGRFELLGDATAEEASSWRVLEERGLLTEDEMAQVIQGSGREEALDRLLRRRLAFRSPVTGRWHALSRLVSHLL